MCITVFGNLDLKKCQVKLKLVKYKKSLFASGKNDLWLGGNIIYSIIIHLIQV